MVYSVYNRCSGESFATTNLIGLSDFTGLGYHKLAYHFSRVGKLFYSTDTLVIIRSNKLEKRKS